MKKIFSITLLWAIFIGCQEKTVIVEPDTSKSYSPHKNQREKVTPTEISESESKNEDDFSTATLLAKRGESENEILNRILSATINVEITKNTDYYTQIFEHNSECQAIFIDIESGYYFGYIKEISTDNATLKGKHCENCEPNGIVILIEQPQTNQKARGAFSSWLKWALELLD